MQKRSLRTRARLKESALSLFSEKSVDATSIEEITDRADLGKGTFYRHFADKDELLVALTEDALDRLTGYMQEATRPSRTLSEVIVALLNAHRRFLEENRSEFLLLFQGRLYLKLERDDVAGLEKPFLDYLRHVQERLLPFLPTGADVGRVRRLACALVGFVSGFFSFGIIGLTEAELESSLTPLKESFVLAASAFMQNRPSADAGAEPSPAA